MQGSTFLLGYFCDPHCPWQRFTCETPTGLLRQYPPKGTELSVFSQTDPYDIADSMNSRPRVTHAFNTPLAVFAEMLALPDQGFIVDSLAPDRCTWDLKPLLKINNPAMPKNIRLDTVGSGTGVGCMANDPSLLKPFPND